MRMKITILGASGHDKVVVEIARFFGYDQYFYFGSYEPFVI